MSISSNIIRLREKYNLTQAELGEIAGVTDRAVSAWEKGIAEPRMGAVQKIADYFSIPKSAIVDDFDENNSGKRVVKGVRIPVLGYVRAGIPIDAVENILDYEEITPELASTGDFFCLKIKGDSMTPQIADSDVVVVRQQSDIVSGEVAIVLVNGDEATCKKVIKYDDSHSIGLVSFNSAYPPMYFSEKEIVEKPVQIIGKVIELRRKF